MLWSLDGCYLLLTMFSRRFAIDGAVFLRSRLHVLFRPDGARITQPVERRRRQELLSNRIHILGRMISISTLNQMSLGPRRRVQVMFPTKRDMTSIREKLSTWAVYGCLLIDDPKTQAQGQLKLSHAYMVFYVFSIVFVCCTGACDDKPARCASVHGAGG